MVPPSEYRQKPEEQAQVEKAAEESGRGGANTLGSHGLEAEGDV